MMDFGSSREVTRLKLVNANCCRTGQDDFVTMVEVASILRS